MLTKLELLEKDGGVHRRIHQPGRHHLKKGGRERSGTLSISSLGDKSVTTLELERSVTLFSASSQPPTLQKIKIKIGITSCMRALLLPPSVCLSIQQSTRTARPALTGTTGSPTQLAQFPPIHMFSFSSLSQHTPRSLRWQFFETFRVETWTKRVTAGSWIKLGRKRGRHSLTLTLNRGFKI